jgi:hypothetical protein
MRECLYWPLRVPLSHRCRPYAVYPLYGMANRFEGLSGGKTIV